MKIITSKPVNYNGSNTTLNIIAAPKTSRVNMPKNKLGCYVGPDGQLYKPIFVFGKIGIDKESLRDLVWHGLRNLQLRNSETQHGGLLKLTRTYYRMHTLLVGDDKYDEKLIRELCNVEGLTLLFEVLEEEQKPYKPSKYDSVIKFEGIRLGRMDLAEVLREAGFWFTREAQQPDQKYREGNLLQMAVTALYISRTLYGAWKKYIPELITEIINQERANEDQVPMNVIKKMMKTCEIPDSKKKQCA